MIFRFEKALSISFACQLAPSMRTTACRPGSVFCEICSSAAKRLYASTLELQYSACVSPYKCLLHIFMLYGYLSLAALVTTILKNTGKHRVYFCEQFYHRITHFFFRFTKNAFNQCKATRSINQCH